MRIFCIYYKGECIIKNQTLERALEFLERSTAYSIGIHLNNN